MAETTLAVLSRNKDVLPGVCPLTLGSSGPSPQESAVDLVPRISCGGRNYDSHSAGQMLKH